MKVLQKQLNSKDKGDGQKVADAKTNFEAKKKNLEQYLKVTKKLLGNKLTTASLPSCSPSSEECEHAEKLRSLE
jgi:hypothetical protein